MMDDFHISSAGRSALACVEPGTKATRGTYWRECSRACRTRGRAPRYRWVWAFCSVERSSWGSHLPYIHKEWCEGQCQDRKGVVDTKLAPSSTIIYYLWFCLLLLPLLLLLLRDGKRPDHFWEARARCVIIESRIFWEWMACQMYVIRYRTNNNSKAVDPRPETMHRCIDPGLGENHCWLIQTAVNHVKTDPITDVHRCLPLCTTVYHCFKPCPGPLCTAVHHCQPLLTTAHRCFDSGITCPNIDCQCVTLIFSKAQASPFPYRLLLE